MRIKAALVGLLAAVAGVGPAAAEFPDKPIKIMAPYAPGGNIDVTARIIADKLKDVLEQLHDRDGKESDKEDK